MSFYFNDGWTKYPWLPICLARLGNRRWYFSCRWRGKIFRLWWGAEQPMVVTYA